MTFKQADRLPDDSGVSVSRQGEQHLALSCGDHTLTVSEFNAARLFAMLALMLEIPLPKGLGKAIHL
jgi:hypothetical protein